MAVIGYTTGVFDLFHSGHVKMLRNAKSLCDKLIVGVTSDELVSYKNKAAVIPFEHRIEVVRSCRYVDLAVAQYDMDKVTAVKKLNASILFVGDDWYGTEKWNEYGQQLNELGCSVIYFPYSIDISSTKINEIIKARM